MARLRYALMAVAGATSWGGRRRHGPAQVALFALLATHAGPDGIARVSSYQLAAVLMRDASNVRGDLRALARSGFAVPVVVHRGRGGHEGYYLPGMVRPLQAVPD